MSDRNSIEVVEALDLVMGLAFLALVVAFDVTSSIPAGDTLISVTGGSPCCMKAVRESKHFIQ